MKISIYRDTHAVSVTSEFDATVRVRLSTEALGSGKVIFECANHKYAEQFLNELYETLGAVLHLRPATVDEP